MTGQLGSNVEGYGYWLYPSRNNGYHLRFTALVSLAHAERKTARRFWAWRHWHLLVWKRYPCDGASYKTWRDIRLSSHQKSQKSPLPCLCLLHFPWNYWNTMEYPTIQAWPATRVLEEGFNLESWWCDSTIQYLHHSMFDERAATIPSKSKHCLHRGSVITKTKNCLNVIFIIFQSKNMHPISFRSYTPKCWKCLT